MKCLVCLSDSVTRELTQEVCYPKECTCKSCGATYIESSKGLILLTEKEEVMA